MAIAIRETAQFPPIFDFSYSLKRVPQKFATWIESMNSFFAGSRDIFEHYQAVNTLIETCNTIQPYRLNVALPTLSQHYRDMVRLRRAVGINMQSLNDGIHNHITHMVASVAVAHSILLQRDNITDSCMAIGESHQNIFQLAQELYPKEALDDSTCSGVQQDVLARCSARAQIYRSNLEPYSAQIRVIMLRMIKKDSTYFDADKHDEIDLYFDAAEELLSG